MSTPMYLHYKLTLKAPAIVSALSGNPNDVVSQPYIPGSVIRGAVAARLVSQGVDPTTPDFRTLVLSGAIRYLHAYPEIEGDRALPTMLSLKGIKSEPNAAIDLAAYSGTITDNEEDFEDRWPQEALVSVDSAFAAISISRGARTVARPRINARLHQQRDRVKGRPWKDQDERSHGAIFAYEFLEAEQVFRGTIQVMGAAVPQAVLIKKLLQRPILVGRSRRAGYGGEAELEFTDDGPSEYEPQIRGDMPAGSRFRVLLTSTYVGRDASSGQVDPAALEPDVCAELDVNVIRRCWAFEVTGGFNQKWRLELPQVLGVRAGSILVLEARKPIAIEALRRIEHAGLGERKSEGFGRMLFMQHSDELVTFALRLQDPEPVRAAASQATTPTHSATEQLAFLERRLVLTAARAEIDRVASIDVLEAVTRRRPTSSLLGRLRTLFRTVGDEQTAQEALAKLAIWCEDGENPHALKRNAREKLDGCRVGEVTLREWLRRMSQGGHGLAGWRSLANATRTQAALTGLSAKTYLTKSEAAQDILNEHSALLRVHLIDGVLSALGRLQRGGVR